MTENEFEQRIARLMRLHGESAVEAIDPRNVAEVAISNAERQRGPLSGLRRILHMTAENRGNSWYGIAAAGMALILVVGFAVAAPGLIGQSPDASPTPTEIATASPTLDPTAACTELDPNAEALSVDRYCTGSLFSVPITFDIPHSGWWPWVPADDIIALINGDSWGMGFMEIANLYVDPCHPDAGLLNPGIGPTVDDLIAGLQAQPAYTVTDKGEGSFGGAPGRFIEVRAAYDEGSCREIDSSWGVTPSGIATNGSVVPTIDRPVLLFVGDVNGVRLVVVRPTTALPSLDEWASGSRRSDLHRDDLLELDSIVGSLRFDS